VVSSTRRWLGIKTLGEARHVLSLLFQKALSTDAAEKGDAPPLVPAGVTAGVTAAATGPAPAKIQGKGGRFGFGLSGARKAGVGPAGKGKGKGPRAQEQEEEEEEEEDSLPESSDDSSSSASDDDSDYDPRNSPSRRRGVNNKPAAVEAPKRSRGRNGGAGSEEKKERMSLEEEIDALLSDNEVNSTPSPRGPIVDVALPLAQHHPFARYTVPQLKQLLKAHGLPLSGKKGESSTPRYIPCRWMGW
jgi:hypothetical protein